MTDREDEGGFRFRIPTKLGALSAIAFAAVSDDEVEPATVQLVDELIAAHEDPLHGLQALPEFIRHWYVAFIVDVEVLNGGHNQLFYNSAGEFAPLAPTAFAAIGSPAAAAILSEAVSLLAMHEPAIAAAQESGTLDAFMESYLDQPFSELDERYMAIEEELRIARVGYLRAHAQHL